MQHQNQVHGIKEVEFEAERFRIFFQHNFFIFNLCVLLLSAVRRAFVCKAQLTLWDFGHDLVVWDKFWKS